MNFIYDTASEVMEDINNVKTMSDEEFFKTYAWDPEERGVFLGMLESDLVKMKAREEVTGQKWMHVVDEWNEEYNQERNFF
ncbi:hypothetical protein DXA50_00150 [Butyricimonas virosa]|uniref:Uncharacterized protein n=1 Tax=Butyricimonas virosa TaxID=544645 RepID=A0A413ITR5_9BACT|nr:hypothetical protein [Butyricimonas virosa]RGY21299.1 hypothetical protein DXA50_00150 [Butyricimonas virosa]